ITGTTTDVAPGTDVVLTITGYDENGEQLEIERTVQTDLNGNYQYQLTAVDGIATGLNGSTVTVVANSIDRNGTAIDAQDTESVDSVIKGDQSTGITNGDDIVTATSGDDLIAGDIGGLKTNFISGHNYNVSVVLDLSGSMNYRLASDVNPSNGEQSRLEIAKAGLKAFIQQMVTHDGVINLQLASFSSAGYAGNNYNKSWVVTKDNLQEIFDYIDGLSAAGGTNPNRGWEKAENWFDGLTTGLESGSVAADSSYENQTYFLTDGKPNTYNGTGANPTTSDYSKYDADFADLASQSKVFAVGVGTATGVQDAVSRFDNTDINGDKIENWSSTNHGEAHAIADAGKLIAYLIGGSENFLPADVGSDTVKGGAGDDILFGDSINTDWITWQGRTDNPYLYPKYSGYSTLEAYLKAEVTNGADPTQQQIYDYVKEHYRDFVNADAVDSVTKGGDDIIYGGSGNDIIIAGAGNDTIYGGSGNDIISTGRGDDTIMYEVLNTADVTGGNGTDTWIDYETNDKIKFSSDFFDGLLADNSNIADYISVEDDANGNAVIKVDRDGALGNYTMSDLIILENKAGLDLQDLLANNQIIIG
ncbi:VWA domain-containing protein, partial [Acinetobacter sp. S40]|uniref:VWA domain-containing protein n=1 Tax=Acinetobacter sp. S40 TaxID=2767434 RepID=UPI00190CBF06